MINDSVRRGLATVIARYSWALRLLVLTALLLSTGCPQTSAPSESTLRIELDANKKPWVRIGLPGGKAGAQSGRSRNGAWAPVYVKLKVGKEPIPHNVYRLVVESTDSEDSPYRFVTAIPNLGEEEDYLAISYIRPGTGNSEFKVSLETTDGRVVQTTGFVRDSLREVLGPRDQLYLAIGSRLPGLSRSLISERPQANEDAAAAQEVDDSEDSGSRRTAYLDSVQLMPDRWFGYDAVDVAILTTGSEGFVRQLLEAPVQRKALAEWVRRGGKLVVSVGRNYQLAAALLEQMPLPGIDKMPLLDCAISQGVVRRRMSDLVAWSSPPQHQRAPLEKIEIAGLKPGPDVHVIVAERPEIGGDKQERPVMVQGSCGLGRVILVGIDLDLAPFTTWPAQRAFWARLLNEFAPRIVANRPGVEPLELGTEMRRRLEDFPGVTPVSFGWVALFILIYIILVGPLDYLILKKVFKRLELTWITFPVVVVAVSVTAYLTAYALKGEDLRINKVDLIEIDLQTPQVYGQSWFTLFSPRIQNYTVGLEPAWPHASTQVTVLDDPTRAGRSGAQGIFSRPYEYAADATGVLHLPVPVWATRTFAASWRAPLSPGAPTMEADVDHVRGNAKNRKTAPLRGTLTNHLGFDLNDVALFYHDHWYPVGTLPAEGFFRIDNLEMGGPKGMDLNLWFAPGRSHFPGSSRGEAPSMAQELIKPLLFHRHDRQSTGNLNSNFRQLDQQWRLSVQPGSADVYRDEVLLVGRAGPQVGPAEQLTADAAMPSRLWLGDLPASGATRPPLVGVFTQETFVRVYIPVRRAQ